MYVLFANLFARLVARIHCQKCSSAVNSAVFICDFVHKAICIFRHSMLSLIDKTCCGCISFPTSKPSAITFFAVYTDNLMSYFAACSTVALVKFSVNDNPSADTCTQCYHYHIFVTFTRTESLFAKCCHICIVTNSNRNIKILRHFCHQIFVFATDIYSGNNHTLFAVNSTGNPNTYTAQIDKRITTLRNQLVYHISRSCEHTFKTFFLFCCKCFG